jgi:uncharacterized protein (TIGR02246 family)
MALAGQASREGTEITALAKEFENALNAGDVEGIAALYADDCRLLPPNAEMTQGKEAVRAIFGGMIAAGLKGTLDTVEAVVTGKVGYRVGRYELKSPDGVVADQGKYIEIWRKIDGEWKIVNDIWNSDLPAE